MPDSGRGGREWLGRDALFQLASELVRARVRRLATV
jgi:hypothetical protein